MSLIGAEVTRSDGPAKVSGTAVYGVDAAEVGMLHAVILRSPVAAGTIRRLDTTKAEAYDGIVAIRTGADQPDTQAGWLVKDQRLLATDEVKYEGEAIAVIAAETREQAIAAMNAVILEIDEIEPLNLERAMAPDARVVHKEWASFEAVTDADLPRAGNLAGELNADPEGVDEAFASAAHIVEDEFLSNRQYQAPIEPKAALASYSDGRFTVTTASQYPFNVRDRVAQFMGVRSSDVRVIGKTIGGGFGGKLDAAVEQFAAFMARETGRPVKIRNERTEDLITATCRDNAVVRLRTALDAEGRMVAREMSVDMDNGAHSGEMPWLVSLPLLLGGAVYEIHGPTRVLARLWYTNTAPTGAFRGVGATYLYAALERHISHIAETLGVDQRSYRLEHLFSDGSSLLNEQVLPDAGILAEAFDHLEAVAPWAELRANLKPNQGIGIGGAVWLTNPMPGQATIKMNEDGTVTVITAANDNGSGAVVMGITQLVAEELGVPVADVKVTMPDTDVGAYDSGSQGSRTTHIVGRAAKEAATSVRMQLCEMAATMLEANVDDIDIVEGMVGVKGSPSSALPIADVAGAVMWTSGPIVATSSYTSPPVEFNPESASGLLFPTMLTPTYHAHLAVVEVDPVTGNVEVLRYVVVQEVGRAINPAGCRGQIQGGVAQGIGQALMENLNIGDDCRYIQRTFEAYGLPLAVDVPDVEIVMMEHPSPDGPFGAKGVAECSIILAPAVLANAVADAVGGPINEIPITPEAVLDAMEAAVAT